MDDRTIKQAIMQQLNDTENAHNVRIPLAIESGSRAWGFAGTDSDYDCRFVYVNEPDWYMSILERRDVIEYDTDGVFDVNGWDLKKFIRNIVKSNAVMFEWLSSNEVYIRNEAVVAELMSVATAFFNPIACSHHYLSMAKKKYAEICEDGDAKLKKYFYVLRPLANLGYIAKYNAMPFMEYPRTLEAIDVPEDIRGAITDLLALKLVSDESLTIEPHETFLAYFRGEIEKHETNAVTLSFDKRRDYGLADEVFRRVIRLVWA